PGRRHGGQQGHREPGRIGRPDHHAEPAHRPRPHPGAGRHPRVGGQLHELAEVRRGRGAGARAARAHAVAQTAAGSGRWETPGPAAPRTSSSQTGADMAGDVLTPGQVRIHAAGATQEEAMREAADILQAAGAVTGAYYDAMQQREQTVSTYMG